MYIYNINVSCIEYANKLTFSQIKVLYKHNSITYKDKMSNNQINKYTKQNDKIIKL